MFGIVRRWPWRLIGRQARDVLAGAPLVAVFLLAAPLVRSRYNRWGANPAELAKSMPGDGLVADPRLGYTRAIDIRAAPTAVWPWLVQIGQGRGGLYSYDGLENLFGCQMRSADRILAEHQRLAPGDLIRLGPPGYPCFRVQEVQPPSTLVLRSAAPPSSQQVAQKSRGTHDTRETRGDRDTTVAGVASWQWQLLPRGEAGTRLLVRQRLDFPDRFRLMWQLIEPVAFVMERRMLLGLKRRAESQAPGRAGRAAADPGCGSLTRAGVSRRSADGR